MEPFDRGNFENEWASALDGAELAPSAALWDQIDMNLSGHEGVVYKKRFVAMRWVAAAAVFMALLTGAIGYYFYDTSEQLKNQLAVTENMIFPEASNTNKESDSQNANIADNSDLNKTPDSQLSTRNSSTVQSQRNSENNITSEGSNSIDRVSEKNESSSERTGNTSLLDNRISASNGVIADRVNDDLNLSLPYSLTSSKKEENQILRLLPTAGYGFTGLVFSDIEFEKKPIIELGLEEEEFDRALWAGLNLSGGAYNPETSGINFGLAQEDADFLGSTSSTQESLIRGSTRGYGLGVGATVSKKLILLGGLQYASVTSGKYLGTDSQVAANSLDATRANFASSGTTNSALIIDTYNFLSVPLEVGYYLIDGRFSLTINPGIDTRIYLNRNTERLVSGSPDQDALITELNPFTFWGQLSTDISYKLSDHYHMVVSPGYKVSLNSFEKGSDIHPALREVTFSMRYVFGSD